MKNSNMTPVKLRLILTGTMVLMAALAIGVFMLGYKQISNYASTSRSVAAQAQASNSSLNELIAAKKELDSDSDVVQRASQIVSESKSYLYQDQIIQDINQFAANSGVTVTNITFGSSGGTTSSGTAATATAPAQSASLGATTPPPSGIKTTTASVTVKNPVDYTKMLTFIHSIESSLFKMRISQVTLSKSTDAKSSNEVTSDVLNIEVYIR